MNAWSVKNQLYRFKSTSFADKYPCMHLSAAFCWLLNVDKLMKHTQDKEKPFYIVFATVFTLSENKLISHQHLSYTCA